MPSQGRRRLRFSFQFNDVKDPIGGSDPAVYARRRRGAAYLVAPFFSVNRPAEPFSRASKTVRAKQFEAAGAGPKRFEPSRLKVRNLVEAARNCQERFRSSVRCFGALPLSRIVV